MDTRQYVIKFSGDFSPSNDLEFTVGGDADGDGDLSPEEMEARCGVDCGAKKERGSGEEAASTLADAPSSASISNWTARGAYCDWDRIDFRDSFRFPVGTNIIDTAVCLVVSSA